MPAPLVAAAAGQKAIPIAREMIEKLNHPILGVRKTIVRHGKKRDVTTTYAFEVRTWELPILALGGILVYAVASGAFNNLFGSGFNLDPMKLDKAFKDALNPPPLKSYADQLKQRRQP